MSNFTDRVTEALKVTSNAHEQGLRYGEINKLDEVIRLLTNGNFKTGNDALQALISLRTSDNEARSDNNE